ncbi:unnamed protein product [Cyclocybe aegerita]|uniref:Uncharacterized protein n=1 Tax=Cyclocybe aegerita TaxID=1973307 RepID=A0A8S0VRM6_CYCAE|nr:unnamed protein product [Cyclocybe aegerita]
MNSTTCSELEYSPAFEYGSTHGHDRRIKRGPSLSQHPANRLTGPHCRAYSKPKEASAPPPPQGPRFRDWARGGAEAEHAGLDGVVREEGIVVIGYGARTVLGLESSQAPTASGRDGSGEGRASGGGGGTGGQIQASEVRPASASRPMDVVDVEMLPPELPSDDDEATAPMPTQPPPTLAVQHSAIQRAVPDADADVDMPPSPLLLSPPTRRQETPDRHRANPPPSPPSGSKRRKTQQKEHTQARSPSPVFIQDDKELRDDPSLIPCLEKEGKEPLLITKTDAKKLYRIEAKQLEDIPVYKSYEREVPGKGPGERHNIRIYLYREGDVELAAWRVYGGYRRFLNYLLERKTAYVKQYSKKKRAEDLEFPVPKFYKEPLEELERAESAKLCVRAQEGGAAQPAA